MSRRLRRPGSSEGMAMARFGSVLVLMVLSSVSFVAVASADPAVIAGSDDPPVSPPTFWADSFWGIHSTIERAFPFTIDDGGQYFLEELEVAVYRYEFGGSTAEFSINSDEGGVPGAEIAAFAVQGVTTVQQVLTAVLSEHVTLDPDTQYWIAGSTTESQVNWSLGDGTFGSAAYRVSGGDWVYDDYANVSAFTLLGIPVGTGACCVDTACHITTEADCADSGGSFFGVDSTCDAPDADGDGLRDECDECPFDQDKIEPGVCGCGLDDDADADGDGVPDCHDECPGADDSVFAPACLGSIPTVSQWGLIVLTLLLLAGAKVRFGCRRFV